MSTQYGSANASKPPSEWPNTAEAASVTSKLSNAAETAAGDAGSVRSIIWTPSSHTAVTAA